ncbi:MAG TPA: hypothetical protein VHG72_21925 [Polyangia bacterium]|nr:hypothetical protein [Polyangia bacterium]
MTTTEETETDATPHPGETQPISADPIPVSAPPASSDPIKTVEDWARAKGMLPEFREVDNPRNPKRLRPKAKPMLVHNKSHAQFRAAKASNRWPIGKELTEAEFDEAIATVNAHVYR